MLEVKDYVLELIVEIVDKRAPGAFITGNYYSFRSSSPGTGAETNVFIFFYYFPLDDLGLGSEFLRYNTKTKFMKKLVGKKKSVGFH